MDMSIQDAIKHLEECESEKSETADPCETCQTAKMTVFAQIMFSGQVSPEMREVVQKVANID